MLILPASLITSTPIVQASVLLVAPPAPLSVECHNALSSMTDLPSAVTQSSSNATLPARPVLPITPIYASAATQVF